VKFTKKGRDKIGGVNTVASDGSVVELVADKDGNVEVPDDFQEITSRLLDAGFVPVKKE
jgi:hypothetical protein